MANITIAKSKVKKESGVVVLPIKEYQRLLMAAVPTFYLSGKEAEDIDNLVEYGLREHRAGRTNTAPSISAAVRKYRKRHAR